MSERVDPYSGRPVEETQSYGDVPTLLEHLRGVWLNTEPTKAQKAAVEQFIETAQSYLANNRPAENRVDDANLIVKLSNNVSVRISPATNYTPGQMQPSNAVEVSNDKDSGKTLATETYDIN